MIVSVRNIVTKGLSVKHHAKLQTIASLILQLLCSFCHVYFLVGVNRIPLVGPLNSLIGQHPNREIPAPIEFIYDKKIKNNK